MNRIYSLQNGTDIRGVAFKDENSELDITLEIEDVRKIALGFATWLTDKNKSGDIKIALGMDSRITGSAFKEAAAQVLTDAGVTVYDCAMATTPSMFMTTVMQGYGCQGAIMFTASHMPYIYNGMKMFTEEGCLDKQDLKDVLDIVVSGNFIKSDKKGIVIEKPLIDDYSAVLAEKIRKGVNSSSDYEKPLKGMKIIVDAGNGAGGFFAHSVLEVLGADTSGSQFLEPDGMFPNHIPNPENNEAMESICRATVENKADMGIIFDTDVDRAAIVDKNGHAINKNALIAVISKILIDENPGATIVTDSVTSNGLRDFLKSIGADHHRFKRGYKNVINEAVRLNDMGINAPLAIETSGHAAMKENYFLDDGAYLVAKILMEAARLYASGKDIGEMISTLHEAKEDVEYRIKIKDADYRKSAEKTIENVRKFAEEKPDWSIVEPNFEGIRVDCEEEEGWFLLRSSLHEPLLVLNIESDKEGGCEKIYSQLEKFLG